MSQIVIGNQTFALVPRDAAHVAPIGKSATDRKLNALMLARETSEAAVVALSYASGKVGKQAREARASIDNVRVVETFARGDLAGLAATISATLGESVRFKKQTDAEGNVLRSAWEDVKMFAGVIEHKLLQLADKGKLYSAKGGLSTAAADLTNMQQLIARTLERKAEIDQADAIRREMARIEREAEEQAEKGAEQ